MSILESKNKNIFFLLLTILIIYALCVVCFHPLVGFLPESKFDLSSESRLPKWLTLPPGLDREDVNVEIYYYAPPPLIIRSNFKAILIGPPPENKVLDKRIGIERWHPESLKNRRSYPSYSIVKINGIEEVIEHRKMEPIFYITDDPKITAVLKKE